MKIAIVNGPNLNMLGIREPNVYGSKSLDELNATIEQLAESLKIKVQFMQSNAEHQLIDYIHQAYRDGVEAIIFNPAAFTHSSIALRDALLATQIPFVEVHLSNTMSREKFRRQSWFSDIAVATICGLGEQGYLAALRYFAEQNDKQT